MNRFLWRDCVGGLSALGLAACLATTGAAACRAQGRFHNALTARNWNNPVSSILDTMLLHNQQRVQMQQAFARTNARRAAQQGAGDADAVRKQQPGESQRPGSSSAVTTFRPAASPLAIQAVCEKLASTPQERQQLGNFFKASLKAYEKEAVKAGKPHDLSLAMAFFIAANYGIVQDGKTPSDAQVDRLQQRLADSLAQLPGVRTATDKQKQQVFETLVLVTEFTQAGYEQGKSQSDSAERATFRKLAAMNLRDLLGVSADRMRFVGDDFTISDDHQPTDQGH